MAFPGALPSFAGFTSGHTLAADNHAAQHNLEQTEIVAVATKVGTGSSTPIANTVLTGTGVGTSAWSQVNLTTMVSGILPVANGGTGINSSTGTGSVVLSSNPSITGGGSWSGSPNFSTPVIADFSNSVHNHQNNAGGGQLVGSSAIVNGSITPNELEDGSGSTWVMQSWTPTYGASGAMTFTGVTTTYAKYIQIGKLVFFWVAATGTLGGTINTGITFTLPLTSTTSGGSYGSATVLPSGGSNVGAQLLATSTTVALVRRYDNANITLGAGAAINAQGFFEVA